MSNSLVKILHFMQAVRLLYMMQVVEILIFDLISMEIGRPVCVLATLFYGGD